MNRWINLLTLGLITVSLFGCSMCCGPYDFDYPTFGGKYQRSNPSWGRVGSIFSDPIPEIYGPSADSNLNSGANKIRESVSPEDDEMDEDFLDDDDLMDELDRELERFDDSDPLPEPKSGQPDSDETTASRLWKKKPLRPRQNWR